MLKPKQPQNQAQAQVQTQAQQPQQQASVGRGFARQGTYMASAGGNAILQALATHVRNMISTDPNNPPIDVAVIDAEQNQLHCGALVLSELRTTANEKVAVVYTVMVEPTVRTSQAMTQEVVYNGKPFNMPLVLTDAFNHTYWDRVQVHMAARHQLPSTADVVSAGIGFITKEMYEAWNRNPDQDQIVNNVFFAAAEGIGSIGDAVSGVQKRANTALIEVANGGQTRLQREFGNRSVIGTTGLPTISDVSLSIDIIPPKQQGRANIDVMNNGGSQLVTTRGYLETVVVAQDNRNTFFRTRRNTRDVEPPCMANFVISDIVNPTGQITIETVAMGLFAALGITVNYAWAEMLLPKYGAENTRDIGMLMVEFGELFDEPNEPIDTQSTKFDERVGREYIDMMYRPEVVISIDFPEAGGISWVGDIFREAAESPDPAVRQRYRSMLARTISDFTGGHFDPNYQGDFTIDADRRILIGYDTDSHGNPVDPRSKNDYLALLTLMGNSDLQLVRDWDLHTRPTSTTGIPPEVRLTVTDTISKRVFSSSARYVTGVRRHLIDPNFLQLFAVACNNAGLTPTPSNQTNSYASINRAAGDLYINNGIGASTNFGSGRSPFGGAGFSGRNFTGRF